MFFQSKLFLNIDINDSDRWYPSTLTLPQEKPVTDATQDETRENI